MNNTESYIVEISYKKPNGSIVSHQNKYITIDLNEDKIPNCNHNEAQSKVETLYENCIVHSVTLQNFN